MLASLPVPCIAAQQNQLVLGVLVSCQLLRVTAGHTAQQRRLHWQNFIWKLKSPFRYKLFMWQIAGHSYSQLFHTLFCPKLCIEQVYVVTLHLQKKTCAEKPNQSQLKLPPGQQNKVGKLHGQEKALKTQVSRGCGFKFQWASNLLVPLSFVSRWWTPSKVPSSVIICMLLYLLLYL